MTDIHVLPEEKLCLCTLYVGLTLVEVKAERKIEDLEWEAKTILPQVSRCLNTCNIYTYRRDSRELLCIIECKFGR